MKIDNSYKENQIANLYQELEKKSFGIEQCGFCEIKTNRKHFGICGIGDLHVAEMVYDRWALVRDYLHFTNVGVHYLGDLLTVSINNYKNSQPQESRFNAAEEMLIAKKEIGYNAYKTLGGVGGNHDEPQQGDRLKDVYISVAREVMESNKINYSPNAMLYKIQLPVYKNKKFLYYKPVYILGFHGRGGAPTERIDAADRIYHQGMGIMKEFNRIHRTNIIPDFIFGGHFHGYSSCDYEVLTEIKNKCGKVTGTYPKTVRVRETSTFASKQSSSFNNSFSSTIIQNANIIDFKFVHNDNFNPKANNFEPEDYLEIVEFPILKRNSNEFTMPAKIYQAHNLDYDLHNKISQKKQKESAEDLLKELQVK